MANIKISQLPASTGITVDSDVLPIVHDGVTQKITPDEVVKPVLAAPGPIGASTASSAEFTDLTATGDVALPFIDISTACWLYIPRFWDNTKTNAYRLNPAELAADVYISLPALSGNDTFIFANHTQTLTNKTLGEFRILDSVGDNYYTISPASLANNYTLYLPTIFANDTFVFEGAQCTLTNKTISGSSNTLSNIGNASLTNSSITINGTSVSLGGSISISTGSGTVTSVGMTVPTGLTVSGSPITTSGTLAISLASGYSIPTTASQTNWDSAYTQRLQWDGGSTNLVAATGRTSLGLGSIATQNSNNVSITGGAVTTTGDVDLGGFITVTAGTAAYLDVPRIWDSSDTNWYRITPSELSSNVYVTLPALSGNDTFVFASHTQTLTNKTLGEFRILDSVGDNYYTITPSSLANNYALYLPTITVNDTFVFEETQCTLTNKTISGSSNTLSNIGNSSLTNSSITINGTAVSLGGSTSVGTVTSVGGGGTVSGITLSGTVTSSGSLILGGSLDLSSPPDIGGSVAANGTFYDLTSTHRIKLRDTSGNNTYTISPTELTVDVTLLLPAPSTADTFVLQSFDQTLTNKTLTSPKIGTAINDTNGNELIAVTATASAVNEITIANAATGNPPTISATGDDTNVSLYLYSKGSGVVVADDFFSSARIKSTSSSSGVGYGTGAGAAVTQTGSITSNVTINNVCGEITTVSSTFSANSFVSFFVSNNTVGVNDTVIINLQSYYQENKYMINVVNVDVGSFYVQIYTPAAVSSAEVLKLNFSVIKSVKS